MANSRIKVVFGNERIITPSGLGIVGGMLGKSNFRKHCDRQKVDPKRSQPQIKKSVEFSYIIIIDTEGKHGADTRCYKGG